MGKNGRLSRLVDNEPPALADRPRRDKLAVSALIEGLQRPPAPGFEMQP
jgi:hypothetical protein